MVSSTYGVSDLVMVVLKRAVVGDWQSNNVETIFHLTYNTSPSILKAMPAQVVEKSFTINSLFKTAFTQTTTLGKINNFTIHFDN